MSTATSRRINRKLISWIAALIILTAIVIFGITNSLYIRLSYSNLKHNHFNVNDNMHASPYAMQVGEVGGIPLLRLVKNSDGTGSPYMIFCDDKISLEKTFKTKDTFIGRYLRHEIQAIRFKDKVGKDNFYAIQVEPELLVRSKDSDNITKNNYVFVNNDYYVIRGFVAD